MNESGFVVLMQNIYNSDAPAQIASEYERYLIAEGKDSDFEACLAVLNRLANLDLPYAKQFWRSHQLSEPHWDRWTFFEPVAFRSIAENDLTFITENVPPGLETDHTILSSLSKVHTQYSQLCLTLLVAAISKERTVINECLQMAEIALKLLRTYPRCLVQAMVLLHEDYHSDRTYAAVLARILELWKMERNGASREKDSLRALNELYDHYVVS
jgi:hypothetical protein